MRRKFIIGMALALLVLVPATATIAADGPLPEVKRLPPVSPTGSGRGGGV